MLIKLVIAVQVSKVTMDNALFIFNSDPFDEKIMRKMKEQRNDWRKNNAQMVASNDGKC